MLATLFISISPVLGQADPAGSSDKRDMLTDVSNHFSSEGVIPTHWLLIAAGAMLLLLSSLSIARWWKHRDEYSHPLWVYLSVAKLAGLGHRDQWLLLMIARQQSLGSPLTLMLSPNTFEHHAQPYIQGRAAWRRAGLSQRARAIHHALFDDDPALTNPEKQPGQP